MTKKLYRSQTDKIIAGVCGGLADYFEIDSTIIRLLFILVVAFGGSGILIYLFLWLLVSKGPQEPAIITKEKVDEVAKEIKEKMADFKQEFKKEEKPAEPIKPAEATKEVAQRRGSLFGWLLVILGALFLVNNFYPWWFRLNAVRYWPVLLILVGLILIVRTAGKK